MSRTDFFMAKIMNHTYFIILFLNNSKQLIKSTITVHPVIWRNSIPGDTTTVQDAETKKLKLTLLSGWNRWYPHAAL